MQSSCFLVGIIIIIIIIIITSRTAAMENPWSDSDCSACACVENGECAVAVTSFTDKSMTDGSPNDWTYTSLQWRIAPVSVSDVSATDSFGTTDISPSALKAVRTSAIQLQYNYNKITQKFCCIAAVCTSAIQLQYKFLQLLQVACKFSASCRKLVTCTAAGVCTSAIQLQCKKNSCITVVL